MAPDDSIGASQRGGRSVIARATFGDRTGIALVGESQGIFSRRVNASGGFEGEPALLEPIAADASVVMASMRVIDDGALASWVSTRGLTVVRFDRQRTARERWTLSLTQGATMLQSASADVREGLLFVSWTTTESKTFAQVFDRTGNERSQRFMVAMGEPRSLAQIVSTPAGALVVGTTGDLGRWSAYALPLRCAL